MCKSQIRTRPSVRASGAMLMGDELPNWLLFKGFSEFDGALDIDRAVFADRKFCMRFVFHKLFHSKMCRKHWRASQTP